MVAAVVVDFLCPTVQVGGAQEGIDGGSGKPGQSRRGDNVNVSTRQGQIGLGRHGLQIFHGYF